MVRSLGLEVWVGVLTHFPPGIGDELVYACPQRIMASFGFQNVLQDLMPPGHSLDELIEDWNSCLSKAINEIAP